MRARVSILLCVVLTTWASTSSAQYYGTELPFVLGSGARVSGLGVSGVSLDGDASAQYYNPAALAMLQWKEFTFFRTSLFDAGATYHAVSYAHPLLNAGTIGVSLLRLDVSGIEERDGTNQLLSNDLHNSQTRLLLGYGTSITPSITAGANIKIDRQSFGTFSGSGIGLDVGVTASQQLGDNRFFRGFRQGLAIQNLIEPSVKLDQERVGDPTQVAFGLTALSAIDNAFLQTTVELVSPKFSPTRIQIGQEVNYLQRYALRIGMDGGTAAYGIGARLGGAAIDYAYHNADIGDNHRFSLSIRFGASTTERQAQARLDLEQSVNNAINERMLRLEQNQLMSSITSADSLFDARQFAEAASRYESALLWDPENEHARARALESDYRQLIAQGDEAVYRRDFVQALFYFREALDLKPDDPAAAADKIEKCNRSIERSEEVAKMTSQMLAKSIDFYTNKAYAHALSGFEDILRLDPTNTLADEYRRKCETHIEEETKRLLRAADKAISSAQYAAAVDFLRAAREYRPHDDSLGIRLNEALRLVSEAAVRERERKLATPPPDPPKVRKDIDYGVLEGQYQRGMEAFNTGDFDRAVRVLAEVWSVDPTFHDVSELLTRAYLFIGMRLYSKDQYEAAMDIWKKVLTLDPDNVKARRYLSKTNDELKRFNTVTDE